MYRVSPFVRRFAQALLSGMALATLWVNLAPASYYDAMEWRLVTLHLPGWLLDSNTRVTLISLTSDSILANSGQHQITVSGVVMAYDDAINTIGCEEAQTIVIQAGGVLLAGYTGAEEDGDGVILDGIGSTLLNHGTIIANGSGLSLFVRDAGTTTVTNTGFISGEKYGVWNKFGIGVLDFTNTGTIESPNAAFFGGTATDLLTNSGTFIGDVRLNGGDELTERVAGSDLFWELGRISQSHGVRIFLLGGVEGAADGAKEALEKAYPGCDVCGTYCPPFEKFNTQEEQDEILRPERRTKDMEFTFRQVP